MKNFVNNNSKLIICAITLIVCVTVICVTGFSYATNNESGTIYTRDELSEQIESLIEEFDAQKGETEELRTSINQILDLHSNDVTWVDLSSHLNMDVIYGLQEHLCYTIIDKIVILDIGGLSFKEVGRGQLWLTLPEELRPITRGIDTITSGIYEDGIMYSNTLVYNQLYGLNIYAHVAAKEVSYWGQMIWKIA